MSDPERGWYPLIENVRIDEVTVQDGRLVLRLKSISNKMAYIRHVMVHVTSSNGMEGHYSSNPQEYIDPGDSIEVEFDDPDWTWTDYSRQYYLDGHIE